MKLSSSSARRIPQPPYRNPPCAPLRSRQWQTSIPALPPTYLAIRHASTTPTQPISQPPPPAAPTPTEPTTYPNLDTITLDDIDLSTTTAAHTIPEKIGYLHEIGLDYGWGPTSLLQWTLEHIHIYADLPWWSSIAATAVLLRLVLFPLYLRSSDMLARQSALVSVTKPITEKMTAAQRAGDQQGVMFAWQELRTIRKRAGISMTRQFAPMVFQGVFAYCGFKLIRAMAHLPVPGLQTGGFLWLQDLTLSDPYLILPALMAGSIHFLVRMGGESGAQPTDQMGKGMVKFMMWGMPGVVFLAMGWQAGALCVWFASGGVLGIGQSLLLKVPRVREMFGIAPLYTPSKEEGQGASPMAAFMQGYTKESPSATEKAWKGAGEGKNAAFMRPAYQSPNLRRNSSNLNKRPNKPIIDVKAITRSPTNPKQHPPRPTRTARWSSHTPSAPQVEQVVF